MGSSGILVHPVASMPTKNKKERFYPRQKQVRDADAPQGYRLTEPRVPRPVSWVERLLPS